MSPWTDLIKKVYKEEHDKNPEFQFKDAMKLASTRKDEMGSPSSAAPPKSSKSSKSSKGSKSNKSSKSRKGRKSRKKRRSRRS